MYIVDTHQHLWDLDRFSYSWTEGIPALNRSFLLDEYRKCVEGMQVEKTIFMECDVDVQHALAEARYAQNLADSDEGLAGIVASGQVESDAFASHLDELLRLPNLRGIRRVLHTQSDDFSQTKRFRENLNRLPDHDLVFDLCVLSRQLPVAIELVQACPEVSFVLDHCGVPDVKGNALDPWRADIRELSNLPNVVACKVSGLVAYADPANWSVDTLRPWVEHVIDCFAWDRVVWGGDWPVCTLTTELDNWIRVSKELVSEASEEEQSKLFHLNAEKIYRV